MINKTAIESPTTTMKDDNQGVLMKLPEPYNIPTCTYITYHYKNSNTTVTGNSSSNHPPPLRSSMKKSDSNSNSNSSSVVQFIPQCQNQIEYTISIDDMTNDEICNTWIQEEEEEAIRRRVQKIVAYANRNGTIKMVKSTSSKNKQLCIRGLESHTKIGSRIRQMNRIIASEKVFVEQDNQWNKSSGIYYNNDVHKIASEYTTISMECQRRAEQIAIQDRIAIEQYIQNEIKIK